jgi:nitrogen fixation-related uncharacterized protein
VTEEADEAADSYVKSRLASVEPRVAVVAMAVVAMAVVAVSVAAVATGAALGQTDDIKRPEPRSPLEASSPAAARPAHESSRERRDSAGLTRERSRWPSLILEASSPRVDVRA